MTAARELAIVADALGKRYPRAGASGDVVALDGVSFAARTGERIGVIGRNGSGKSTLLQLVAGVASPTSGRIDVQGSVSAVLTLGMGLREDLTGRQNVDVDAALRNIPRERWAATADAVLEFAELGDFGDRPIKTYSTGMKARLAFAMLVTIDPEILLIDETLSVGDFRFSQKATARMQELCDRGSLVMIVSHGVEGLRSLCDRCIWLDRGRLRADGPAAEVIDAYLEEVRRDDERTALERFARGVGERSLAEGWRLAQLAIEQPHARGALRGAAPAAVSVTLEVPPGESGSLVLEVVRLDGLEVYSCACDLEPVTRGRARRATLRTPRLGLGPGMFRVTCTLAQASQPRAEASAIIEVEHPPELTGGLPALDVAWRVLAHEVTGEAP